MSFSTIYINKIPANEKTIKVHTNKELCCVVLSEINRLGWDCSLNHIDVSDVTDFTSVFHNLAFTGDISEWDVSKGVSFNSMFSFSKFNSKLLNWNMSSAEDLSYMFASSSFNHDLSLWNVSKAENMEMMFAYSDFNKDLSLWDVSNVTNMREMFYSCEKFQYADCLEEWNAHNFICNGIFDQINVENIKQLPSWFKKHESCVKKEISRMKKLDWKTGEYNGIKYDAFKLLDCGKHTLYLDRDTNCISGKPNGNESVIPIYDFEITENMSKLDYAVLYKEVQKKDFECLNCVYKSSFSQKYPWEFVNALQPFKIKTKNNEIKTYLYLLNTINWHASKADLPCLKRDGHNLKYCKNL